MTAAKKLQPVENPLPEPVKIISIGKPALIMLVSIPVLLTLGMLVLFSVHQGSKTAAQNKQVISTLSVIRNSVSNNHEETVVLLKIMYLKKIDLSFGKRLSRSIVKYSKEYSRDPELIMAIMYRESHFNPKAVSKVGAKGLMQLMPSWAEILKVEKSLFDMETNIKCGLTVLGFYEEWYGDLDTALAAYNRGPSKVDWDLVKDRDPGRNGYVDKVLSTYHELLSLEVD